MTPEQLTHYLKGGIFLALYSPKVTHDLDRTNLNEIGQKIEVFQNFGWVAPLVETYSGQHAFNSYSISGWFPEEDIEILEMLDSYIDHPEPLPRYVYKITYLDQSKIKPNFGKVKIKVPFTISREYTTEMDKYVVEKLSNPRACKVEKCVWDGSKGDLMHWEIIYEENAYSS